MTYSQFINKLKVANVKLDRKILADRPQRIRCLSEVLEGQIKKQPQGLL